MEDLKKIIPQFSTLQARLFSVCSVNEYVQQQRQE
jgi:hypothetical protein